MQKDDQLRVHEFGKGCGFAIITDDMAKEKIEGQLCKATKAKISPTNRLPNKIQKKLCELRKENKFRNMTYFELYLSGPIPPCVYGTIEVHKPEKNYHANIFLYNR